MGFHDKAMEVIELLKGTGINGCITGSSMIGGEDMDGWDSQPDIDLFVYAKPQLQYAANLLMMKYGFKPANAGEEWKLARINEHEQQRKMPLSTVKLERDGIIVNVTWKDGKNNIFSVLASFDMSIIMVGYDIRKGVMLDLRTAKGMVLEDRDGRWSPSEKVAYPNPLRDQDVDMYGTEMWVRQFSRVIKYWNRGYDTRPMARFYLKLIDGVLMKGALFQTDKSQAAYDEFESVYEPMRDQIKSWLDDKEGC